MIERNDEISEKKGFFTGDYMLKTKRLGNYLQVAIPSNWENHAIEQILKEVWETPKKLLHQWRMDKTILLNGMQTALSTKVKENDELSLPIFTKGDYGVIPNKLQQAIQILYEDDHLIIVNKPARIATHPNGASDKTTLANGIANHLQEKGETCTVKHIHRLDQDTTGAILFAKHYFAGAILDKKLERREIKRIYVAAIHGKLTNKKGIIRTNIGRDRHHPTRRRVSPTGQTAITHFQLHQYNAKRNISTVLCWLETGRTHQIRVHFSSIGHPLVGDTLYGGKPIFHRQALHAQSIEFIHPITLEKLKVTAPFIDEMSYFYTE